MKSYLCLQDVKFLYHGDWADPELVYKNKYFNYYSIEQCLLDDYKEEHPKDIDCKNFDKWAIKNNYKVYDYLINAIEWGNFQDEL